jgi:hypothetical protein
MDTPLWLSSLAVYRRRKKDTIWAGKLIEKNEKIKFEISSKVHL